MSERRTFKTREELSAFQEAEARAERAERLEEAREESIDSVVNVIEHVPEESADEEQAISQNVQWGLSETDVAINEAIAADARALASVHESEREQTRADRIQAARLRELGFDQPPAEDSGLDAEINSWGEASPEEQAEMERYLSEPDDGDEEAWVA